MFELALTTLLLLARPASAADPPWTAQVPPHALVFFSFDAGLKAWITTFEMTTAMGACYEVSVNYSQNTILSSATMNVLLGANWMVDQELGSPGIRVYGTRTREGSLDAVRSLRIVNRLVVGEGKMPTLSSVGAVKVEVRTDDGKARAIRTRRPTGPDIRDESFVEFDIAPLPTAGPVERRWQSAWGISFRASDPDPDLTVMTDIDPNQPWKVLDDVMESFSEFGCKVERIGKTRLRVYGRVSEGRFHPALKGRVESDDLKPEELPRVSNARS